MKFTEVMLVLAVAVGTFALLVATTQPQKACAPVHWRGLE
jgi:hypothetical protein